MKKNPSLKADKITQIDDDLLSKLNTANQEIADQLIENKKNEDELEIAEKKIINQTDENESLLEELVIVKKELVTQKKDKKDQTKELNSVQNKLARQNAEKADRASELVIANKELIFQKSEKRKRAQELVIANKELIVQDKEKKKQANEFIVIKKAMINQSVEIENLTYQNQLSGLANRKFFVDALGKYDHEANLPISIIMGDINGLAIISNSIGKIVVDEILIRMVKVMRHVVRRSDISIFFSNGEFALLLPKTSAKRSKEIINKLKDFASNEKAGAFEISVSCGTKTKVEKHEDLNDVVKAATDQLNHDKKSESPAVETSTIGLIMEMLFEKNEREMFHSSRVSEICENLATKLNFDKGLIDRIRTTGMLHDIGKIGIDERILNKKDKLDQAEWDEIRKHPDIGYRILVASNEFVIHANDVLQHHERIDGKGYPKGLKGEDISLVAKIIAIADTYDALISERPYRKAISKENALEEIVRCSGSQFDAEIVKVFVKMMKNETN